MEQKINYIAAHKKIVFLLKSDQNIRAIHKSFVESIFSIWNERGWVDTFRVGRDDLMETCKISNRKTYYSVIEELLKMEYITYEPSKNPEIASLFGMGKKVSCAITSDGSCAITSDGSGGGTLYKLLNNETIKLIEANAELVNEKISFWISSGSNSGNASKETLRAAAVRLNTTAKILSERGIDSFVAYYGSNLKSVKTDEMILDRMRRWSESDTKGTDAYREKTEPLKPIRDFDHNGMAYYTYEDSNGKVYGQQQVYEEGNLWYKK